MRVIPIRANRKQQHNSTDNYPTDNNLAVRTRISDSARNGVCKLIVLKLRF